MGSNKRCREPGWEEIICPDGRRGLWVRCSAIRIEFCAGREGDDEYGELEIGTKVTAEKMWELSGCMLSALWAKEMAAKGQGWKEDVSHPPEKENVMATLEEPIK